MKALKITALIALGLWMTLRTLHAFAGDPYASYIQDARAAVAAIETSGDRELGKRQKAAEAAIGTFERDVQALESRKGEVRPNIESAAQKIAKLEERLQSLESSPEYASAAADIAKRSRLGRAVRPDPQIIKDQKALAAELEKARKGLKQWQDEQKSLDARIEEIRAAQSKADSSARAANEATAQFLSEKKLVEKDGKAVGSDELKLQEARAAAGRMTQGWETEGLDTRLLLSDYQALKQSGKLTALELVALEEKFSRALDSSYLGQYIDTKFKTPQFCESVLACSKPQAIRDAEWEKMVADPWGTGAGASTSGENGKAAPGTGVETQ